jgi:hypothetical protein
MPYFRQGSIWGGIKIWINGKHYEPQIPVSEEDLAVHVRLEQIPFVFLLSQYYIAYLFICYRDRNGKIHYKDSKNLFFFSFLITTLKYNGASQIRKGIRSATLEITMSIV